MFWLMRRLMMISFLDVSRLLEPVRGLRASLIGQAEALRDLRKICSELRGVASVTSFLRRGHAVRRPEHGD